MSEAIEAPSPDGLIGEARVVVEFPKLLLRSSALARQPRGSGQRVMVLPGFDARFDALEEVATLIGAGG